MKIRKIAAIVMATMVLSSGTALAGGYPVTPISTRVDLQSGGVKKILASGWRSNAHNSVSWKVFNSDVTLSNSYPLYFRLRTNESLTQNDHYASSLYTFKSEGTKSISYDTSVLSSIGDTWYMRAQTDSDSTKGVKFSVTYSY